MTDKTICIAKILTAHGVRGLVKVDCFLEDPAELEKYNPLMTADGKPITLTLKNPLKGRFIAEIKGISDRNDAEKYRNIELFTMRENFPEAGEGVYYEDLVGLEVRNKNNEVIGKISAVENFGASDLIQVKPLSGKSFYVPFTEPYVGDVEGGFITIDQFEEFMA